MWLRAHYTVNLTGREKKESLKRANLNKYLLIIKENLCLEHKYICT